MFIKNLVNIYLKNLWDNYRRSLSFEHGREELLCNALLRFHKIGTTTPQPVFADKECLEFLTNPVVADGAGVFPDIYLDDKNEEYTITLENGDGQILAIVNTDEAFEI